MMEFVAVDRNTGIGEYRVFEQNKLPTDIIKYPEFVFFAAE